MRTAGNTTRTMRKEIRCQVKSMAIQSFVTEVEVPISGFWFVSRRLGRQVSANRPSEPIKEPMEQVVPIRGATTLRNTYSKTQMSIGSCLE